MNADRWKPLARFIAFVPKLVAGALCVIAMIYSVCLFRELPSSVEEYRDFNTYYVPSLALSRGINPYTTDFAGLYDKVGCPFGYLDLGHNHLGDTPAWFLAFIPLTKLRPYRAYWTWFSLNLIALIASVWLMIYESELRGAAAWIVAALVLMYPPIATNFWFAQSEVLLLLLFVLMLAALKRGRDLTAGLFLAAASLLRAYPLGMLGYLVVLRRWTALMGSLVYLVVGGLLTIALAGPQIPLAFVGATGLLEGAGTLSYSTPLGQPIELVRHPNNLNLAWAVRFPFDHTGRHPNFFVNILALVVEVALLVATFAATWRSEPGDDAYWSSFSLWIISVTLLSPIAWTQFMVCFLPLFVGIGAFLQRHANARPALYLAVTSFIAISLFPSKGYPFPVVLHLVERLFASHRSILRALPEAVSISLALAWLAAFQFAFETAAIPAPQPQVDQLALNHR